MAQTSFQVASPLSQLMAGFVWDPAMSRRFFPMASKTRSYAEAKDASRVQVDAQGWQRAKHSDIPWRASGEH